MLKVYLFIICCFVTLSVTSLKAQPAKKIQIKLQLNGLETIMEGSDSIFLHCHCEESPFYYRGYWPDEPDIDYLSYFKIIENGLNLDTPLLQQILDHAKFPELYKNKDTIGFEDFAFWGFRGGESEISIIDINNDGYKDIILYDASSGKKLSEFGIFMFNSKKMKFVLDTSFTKGQMLKDVSKSGKYVYTVIMDITNQLPTIYKIYKNVVRNKILVPLDVIDMRPKIEYEMSRIKYISKEYQKKVEQFYEDMN